MKSLYLGVALSLLLTPTARSAPQAATYTVNVAVEQPTRDDFKTMTDWIKGAPVGAEVPEAILQPGTAAMAEIAAAVLKRVEAPGRLTLDDGSSVALLEGDLVNAVPQVVGQPSTPLAIPPVVIQKGRGIATTLGRTDIIVPSSM